MVYSLLMLLKGPMQSWGDESRYQTRGTASTPSKSGVVGIVAAAEGRRRTDPIEDLAQLPLAVRVDEPGTLLRDYQTAQTWQRKKVDTSLVTRYFLSDAAFLAAIESPDREQLEKISQALDNPQFPLFLGRRSCPAPVNLNQGIVEKPCVQALKDHEQWFASKVHKKQRAENVELPIYRDALPNEKGERRQDVPLSFNPEYRKYGWREVAYAGSVQINNPLSSATDPFFEAVISV